jgi:hypothetical protein
MSATATATVEVLATVRSQFGLDLVPGRVTTEEQVRTFPDAQLGAMDAERIVALGRAVPRTALTRQPRAVHSVGRDWTPVRSHHPGWP